jgi:hypothetical protein
MRAIAILTMIGFCFLAGNAHADSTTDAICAPYQASWAKADSGRDLVAMDRVIATIPSLCSDLKDRAQLRRDVVAAKAVSKHAAAAKHDNPRSDAQLKPAFQAIDWLCSNLASGGFDLEKAYTSFPIDKLVLQSEESKPDAEGKYQSVVRAAVGPLYKIEYRFQISLKDQSKFGYTIYIMPADIMSPIFSDAAAQKKFLSAFGTETEGPLGPRVGLGPKNEMLNLYPLNISIWSTGLIDVDYFSPSGLNQVGAMCKK